jgi:hypothetical protein
MEITLTTPSLIFPTVSLLMLAYTNRFIALAGIIRNMHDKHLANPSQMFVAQIKSLRFRIILIRNMQACGVFSMILSTIAIFLIYLGNMKDGAIFFGVSLLCLTVSLGLSLYEIILSVDALKLHLKDMENEIEKSLGA